MHHGVFDSLLLRGVASRSTRTAPLYYWSVGSLDAARRLSLFVAAKGSA